MPTALLEKKQVLKSYYTENTTAYKQAFEPELLQKEIDCCTAATD